jgi:methyltransferase-like protein/predicted O-methyltransferase YrrM
MSEPETTSYDEIPYASNVFHYSHPDRLATMAALLGVRAPAVDRCRVLELGCGTGSNLIPMALALPEGRFVGIDLSSRQVGMGREVAGALGLTNLDLKPLSILDVGADFGPFDYILCHGVYSWVPPEVQDKILRICKEHLAADGVAYVSYNTYPGWHLRAMTREMLRYHAEQFPDAAEKVAQARALLDFLIETAGPPDSLYGVLLRSEGQLLAAAPDSYLFHEHLEAVNAPVYFHEFAARAAAKGLQYLGEARPLPLPNNLTPQARETLEGMAADRIQAEQYLDFVRNRMFRWTLLCHAAVPLRAPSARPVRGMYVTGVPRSGDGEIDLGPEAALEFHSSSGASLSTRNPLLKAALLGLARAWPRAVPFPELLAATQELLARAGAEAPAGEAADDGLADALLQCFLIGLVELNVQPPRFVAAVSERPVACPLARLQAADGERVANRRHRMILLGEFERQILRRLDGSRDQAALLDTLADGVRAGELSLEKDGEAVRDAHVAREMMRGALGPTLTQLAQNALLVR